MESPTFNRYTRIMLASFAIVLAVVAALLGASFNARVESELAEDARGLTRADLGMEILIHATNRYVLLAGDTLASAYRERWFADSVPDVPAFSLPLNIGAIHAKAPLLLPEARRQAGAAIALAPLFRAVADHVDGFVGAYFLSANQNFVAYYASNGASLAYNPKLRRRPWFADNIPAANPEREIRWSLPYTDIVQGSKILTCSLPVYADGEFLGVIGLDLALSTFRHYLDSFSPARGTLYLVEEDGEPIFAQDSVSPQFMQQVLAGRQGWFSRYGNVYAAFTPLEASPWHLVSILPRGEILTQALAGLLLVATALVGGMMAVLILTFVRIRRDFIRPSQLLLERMSNLSLGQPPKERQVPAAWRQYFAEMEGLFADHTRLVSLGHELDTAARIQQAILPRRFPWGGGIEIAGRMTPASDVGGDFFDAFSLPDGRLGLAVADVSGKGLAAGLFMVMAHARFRGLAPNHASPGAALAALNRHLAHGNEAMMFVTMLYAIVDPASGELSFASAGHPPALVTAASGNRLLELSGDLVLGIEAEAAYRDMGHRLAPGETLILYTDGVTEAANAAGELFGEERLQSLPAMAGADETLASLTASVAAFQGDAPAADDLTLLCAHFDPEPLRGHIESAAQLQVFLARAETWCGDHAPTAGHDLLLCLDELVTNSLAHGGATGIDIDVRHQGGRLRLLVVDDGGPFDPFLPIEANAPYPLAETAEGGLGLRLVAGLAEKTHWEYRDGCNRSTLDLGV